MTTTQTSIRILLLSLFAGSLLFGLVSCDADTQRAIRAATSQAYGEVSDLSLDHESRIVNGEFDYGVTVSFTIKNTGEAGIIEISPRLSCSEGEWSREQNLQFTAGEQKSLTYFFQEPTINSSNIEVEIRTIPGVNP